METYINALYGGYDILMRIGIVRESTLSPEDKGESDARFEQDGSGKGVKTSPLSARVRAKHVLQHVQQIRSRLGWDVREFDIQLLSRVKQSSALSIVLGAGVSAADGCGAPSWSALVKELLEVTLANGLQISGPSKEDFAESHKICSNGWRKKGSGP